MVAVCASVSIRVDFEKKMDAVRFIIEKEFAFYSPFKASFPIGQFRRFEMIFDRGPRRLRFCGRRPVHGRWHPNRIFD